MSLRIKLLILTICCVLIPTTIITIVGITNMKQISHDNAREILHLECESRANEVNVWLEDIEQAVAIVSDYAMIQMQKQDVVLDSEKDVLKFNNEMKEILFGVIEDTDGVSATYLHFNSELGLASEGMYLEKDKVSKQIREVLTDKLKQQQIDGWDYVPTSDNSPVWLEPYDNYVTERRVVSYIRPIFFKGQFVATIGMDFDMNVLIDNVRNVELYETGNAMLMDENGKMLYQRNFPAGANVDVFGGKEECIDHPTEHGEKYVGYFEYQWEGQNWKLFVLNLRNEMKLGVTVPIGEIESQMMEFIDKVIVTLLLALLFTVIVTIQLTGMITKLLKELNVVAKRIAKGDADVTIHCNTKDEVGELAESFRITAVSLNHYMSHLNQLAWRDGLTGAWNNTAYKDKITKLEERMQQNDIDFTVLVADVNNLKKINDSFGHEAGDHAIIETSKLLMETFGDKVVYRIGGDEFAVILEGVDSIRYQGKIRMFHDRLKEDVIDNGYKSFRLQVAIGASTFQNFADKTYQEVFRRADEEMYENKEKQKEHDAKYLVM